MRLIPGGCSAATPDESTRRSAAERSLALRILFAGGNGWLPEATGGTQNSTEHLIRQAGVAGHDCAVLCGLVGRGAFGLRLRAQRKVLGRPFSTDRILGYEVMRTWTPFAPETIGAAVARFRPDVAVVQTMGSARAGGSIARARGAGRALPAQCRVRGERRRCLGHSGRPLHRQFGFHRGGLWAALRSALHRHSAHHRRRGLPQRRAP